MRAGRASSWENHVARMGENRGAYGVLVGRPEGRRSLGIRSLTGKNNRRFRWQDNIKMDFQEIR